MMEIAEMDWDLLHQGWNTMMRTLKLQTQKVELHEAHDHIRVSYYTSITGVMRTYDTITDILWEDFTIPSPSDEDLIYPYEKFDIPELRYIILVFVLLWKIMLNILGENKLMLLSDTTIIDSPEGYQHLKS